MSEPAHRMGYVSLAGRPNAGKSTLLNALVGERVAITAPQPQTTRTSFQGVLTTPEAQVVFVDMPGIHRSDTLFNKKMMDTVRSALADRDLILFVADAMKAPSEEDEKAVSSLPKTAKAILVPNKIDRVADKRLLLPFVERYMGWFPFVEAVPVSARAAAGIDELKRALIQHLPEGPVLFPKDYLTDQPVRFLAAEIIRERILFAVKQEVPHAAAVLIDKWEETPRLIRISATIYVERPGQKTILIGRGGQVLKKIGSEARLQIEKLVGTKVFLSLFVKVKPKWREDPSFLNTVDWRSMIGSEQ